MRTYWLRILLGALAVFAVGMIGITFARRTRDKVTAVVTGSGPAVDPAAVRALRARGQQARTAGAAGRQSRGSQEGVLGRPRGEARRLVARPGTGRLPARAPTSRATRASPATSISARIGSRTRRSSSAPRATRDLVEFGTVTLHAGRRDRAAARAGSRWPSRCGPGTGETTTTPIRPMSWPSGPNRWPTRPRQRRTPSPSWPGQRAARRLEP